MIDRTTISGNACAGDGSGVLTDNGSTLTLTGSSVLGNTATGYGTGGIASYGGAMTIDGTLVANNVSVAAGIYLFAYPGGTNTVIKNSVIRDNGRQGVSGVGAIWSDDYFGTAAVRIENTAISHNVGGTTGGIYGSGQFTVVNSTIDHNTGGYGGGMYFFGELTMTGSAVTGNTGTRGTGGMVAFNATVVESTISGNTGVSCGGIYGYALNLIRSTVSGHRGPAGRLPLRFRCLGRDRRGGDFVRVDPELDDQREHGDRGPDAPVLRRRRGGRRNPRDHRVRGPGVGRELDGRVQPGDERPADIHSAGGVDVFVAPYVPDAVSTAGVRNTIIAQNQSNGGAGRCGGVRERGHNLIGVLTPAAAGFVASDLKGTAAHPIDPKLRPLASYGGPTQTHALAPDSPGNAGDNAGCAGDGPGRTESDLGRGDRHRGVRVPRRRERSRRRVRRGLRVANSLVLGAAGRPPRPPLPRPHLRRVGVPGQRNHSLRRVVHDPPRRTVRRSRRTRQGVISPPRKRRRTSTTGRCPASAPDRQDRLDHRDRDARSCRSRRGTGGRSSPRFTSSP